MDANQLKIETFPNVNDTPRLPTAQRPGNGSHIISKFNNLVEAVSTELKSLSDSVDNDLSRFSGSIEYVGDRVTELDEKTTPRLIQKPPTGGFGSYAIIDDLTTSVSAYLTQNSGIRIQLSQHNYFSASCTLWLNYQNKLYPIDVTLNSTVKPRGIAYDWYFPSREGYPGEIYDNFDIFAYIGLEIGAGANLESIDTTKPGLHFSLVSDMFDNNILDIYSNYAQRMQFTIQIKSFYLFT